MTGERRLLCWMAAWFIGVLFNPTEAAGGSSGQPSTDDGCTPPTDSSVPVGLRGYRRYFANDSLIGCPVPCTRDDKICFRHNLVFDPIFDKCMPLLEKCEEQKILRTVNRTELEHGSGRALGSCPEYDDPCPGHRMAYDGLCYREKIVRDVICGCNATLSSHILGGMECRAEPSSPISVQQPEDDGSCVIPDFRTPDLRRSMLSEDPLSSDQEHVLYFDCESTQMECFTQQKIWVTGHEGCHTLLEQGPCAEDHVVALDRHAKESGGRAEGTCVHVRGGCPKGYKRMIFDGQCHEDREIAIVAPGETFFNEFGSYVISNRDIVAFYFTPYVEGSSCVLRAGREFRPHIEQALTDAAMPPCGPDNKRECSLYEVVDDPPLPHLSS